MADRFPRDCWDKHCEHFRAFDMSIDDYHCSCTLLKVGCDACDEDYCFVCCPLPDPPKEETE